MQYGRSRKPEAGGVQSGLACQQGCLSAQTCPRVSALGADSANRSTGSLSHSTHLHSEAGAREIATAPRDKKAKRLKETL